MGKFIDMTNQTYNQLTVISLDTIKTKQLQRTYFKCRCDLCGNIVSVRADKLKSGHTKSCGCLSNHNTYKLVDNKYYIGLDINKNEFYFDIDDYEIVSTHSWLINNNGYVTTKDKFGKNIMLHRLIMNPPDDLDVDHKNGNRTDCRRNNMRICTRAQNLYNTRLHDRNSSGVKGVYFSNSKNRWIAEISVNKKRKHLGSFVDFNDAVKKRMDAEKQYFGEYSFYLRE